MNSKTPFTDFSKLLWVVANIGVDIDELSRERLEKLWIGEEIEGNSSLISNRNGGGLYEILPDGSVIRVIVHVPQGPPPMKWSQIDEFSLLNEPENWHRFHVLWCKTLDDWSHRLRKTNRNDGRFTYPLRYQNGTEYKPELREGGRELQLCRNCIKLMPTGRLQDEFNLQDFLKEGPIIGRFAGVEEVSDFDRIPNVYPADWSRIATEFKKMRLWKCEGCYLDLSAGEHQRFLHAHHKDHRPHNCSIANLQALCIRCHAAKHPSNAALQQSEGLKEFNRLFPAEHAA
jgi:hypothetical protein